MKTNALRIVLFLIGVALNSIPSFSQLYTTEIQKIRELVSIAQRVPVLDSLVSAQDKQITRMTQIISADSLIKLSRARMIEALGQEKDSYKGLYEAQLILTKLEKKEKRRWKRRTFACVILGVGLFVILN